MEELVRKWRPYAALSWAPKKAWQEVEMVRRLSDSLASGGAPTFCNIKKFRDPSGKDLPPDVIGTDAHGRSMAFEVTELVDQCAIEENVRRFRASGSQPSILRTGDEIKQNWSPVYRLWDAPSLLTELERILREKDGKLRGVSLSKYERVVLVIHSDEFELSSDIYVKVIGEHQFSRPDLIREAYVLLPYRPLRETYPFVEIQFD
jgi:hypothetical protein